MEGGITEIRGQRVDNQADDDDDDAKRQYWKDQLGSSGPISN